jgi:threonyl-tRNA synthetase
VGRKIRDAEVEKMPYMLIVGEDEEKNGTVSVRKQGEGDQGVYTPANFAQVVNDEIKSLLKEL